MKGLEIRGKYTGSATAQEAQASISRALDTLPATFKSLYVAADGSVQAGCGSINFKEVTPGQIPSLLELFRAQHVRLEAAIFNKEVPRLAEGWFVKAELMQEIAFPAQGERLTDVGDILLAIIKEARDCFAKLNVEIAADTEIPETGILSIMGRSHEIDADMAEGYIEDITEILTTALAACGIPAGKNFEASVEQVPRQ